MSDSEYNPSPPLLKAPPEFAVVAAGNRVSIVSDRAREEISDALLHGAGCRAMKSAGRSGVWTFDYPGGAGVIRQYHRGGVMGDLGIHVYLGNRPLAEFTVHREAESRGVPVPSLLGVMWEQQGAAYRGALATERLKGDDLLDYLRYRNAPRKNLLESCGNVIRQMHDCGLWHADLQVKNLFVSPERVYLLDLDKASFRTRLRKVERYRNLLRLRRSFEKRELPMEYFQRILDGYGGGRFPLWLDALYRARGLWSDNIKRRK